jgi:UDP-N-acetylmuramoyl-tripeptide--D-alanyl-D-alanine ligase
VIPLTLAEVASAVGGVVHGCDGAEVVSGSVEFDSRRVAPGGLFVAVPGERADGHDFATAAMAAGAVGVLAGRPVGVASVLAPRPGGGSRSRSYALPPWRGPWCTR